MPIPRRTFLAALPALIAVPVHGVPVSDRLGELIASWRTAVFAGETAKMHALEDLVVVSSPSIGDAGAIAALEELHGWVQCHCDDPFIYALSGAARRHFNPRA